MDFQKDKVENTYFLGLPKIGAFMPLSNEIQNRLSHNWEYTESKYPDNRGEHIRYFLNLCKKEGRGGINKTSPLKGVFTEALASQAEKELYIYYGIG